MTGIGGGILLSPILALHFGIPIRQAIGTSLVAVITTSAASSSVARWRWFCAWAHSAVSSSWAGLLVGIFVHGRIPAEVERAGVLLMLATPVVRVAVAGILFLREKDWKYGAIAFGVLAILLLGAVFGVGEH